MKFKKIDSNTWEGFSTNGYDFVITKEHNQFILDMFKSDIKTNNKAYLESFEFDSLNKAKNDALSYI